MLIFICRVFWENDFDFSRAEGSAKALRTTKGRRDSTRLETRTKESSASASQRVIKPQGAVKANCLLKPAV